MPAGRRAGRAAARAVPAGRAAARAVPARRLGAAAPAPLQAAAGPLAPPHRYPAAESPGSVAVTVPTDPVIRPPPCERYL